MGPTERMLSVLARLAHDRLREWTAQDLRRDISGYEPGPPGDRNWQYDSQALRARGLIQTDIRRPHMHPRTGVRIALPAKPDDLYLSAEEHAALVRVRRSRQVVGMPNPVDGGTTRGRLEIVTNALRRLEERGEWMTVGELARDMGVRADRLLPLLEAAWCLDVGGRYVFGDALVIEGYADDRGLSPTEVRICVVRSDDDERPLRGTGLALLGVGAYTLAEIRVIEGRGHTRIGQAGLRWGRGEVGRHRLFEFVT